MGKKTGYIGYYKGVGGPFVKTGEVIIEYPDVVESNKQYAINK